jgi:hypothetical protein
LRYCSLLLVLLVVLMLLLLLLLLSLAVSSLRLLRSLAVAPSMCAADCCACL